MILQWEGHSSECMYIRTTMKLFKIALCLSYQVQAFRLFMVWDVQVPFGKLSQGCHVPFSEERLLSDLSASKCFWAGSPVQKTCHALSSWLHMSARGHSSLIAQFGGAHRSRTPVGDARLVPNKNDGSCCALGHFKCCRNVLVSLLSSVLWTISQGFKSLIISSLGFYSSSP